MISFIVPAHNEEALIGRTLAALHASAQAFGEAYEIIVASDASTDRTVEIAVEHGARVVSVSHRQIAATRNAGAHVATGDLLFFVDADTAATKSAVRSAVRAMRRGAVGGGCRVRFDGDLPRYAAVLERVLPPLLHALKTAPGCFIYCTRQAYLAAGGFDEALFIAEEVALSKRLKQLGRFVMLREWVVTSARKLRVRTAVDLLRVFIRLALGGKKAFTHREGLEFWYGARGAAAAETPS